MLVALPFAQPLYDVLSYNKGTYNEDKLFNIYDTDDMVMECVSADELARLPVEICNINKIEDRMYTGYYRFLYIGRNTPVNYLGGVLLLRAEYKGGTVIVRLYCHGKLVIHIRVTPCYVFVNESRVGVFKKYEDGYSYRVDRVGDDFIQFSSTGEGYCFVFRHTIYDNKTFQTREVCYCLCFDYDYKFNLVTGLYDILETVASNYRGVFSKSRLLLE